MTSKMMEVSIVGTVGLPAKYGGFETLVEHLTLNAPNGLSYTVYCSSKAYPDKQAMHNGASLVYIPLSANGISSILYDIASLCSALFRGSRTILILGVSGCLVLPLIRLIWGKRVKLVTNIDGLEWKRAKWGALARWFLKLSEKIAVKYSDVVIADNQAIVDHVSLAYRVEAHLIAYGGEHALNHSKELDISTIIPFSYNNYALTVCRIEPENNIHIILEGFVHSVKNLVIVGNWKNSKYGKELYSLYGNRSNIQLLNPIYDQDKLYALRVSCALYVHGHSAGGTNPSLVEMMHFGKPIIAFDCVYNQFSTEGNCDFFKDSIGLTKLLQTDLGNSKANLLQGIATDKYKWTNICRQYESLF